MERTKFCVAVHLFLIEDNKILLGKRINSSYANNMYGVIAGHVEKDENVYNAMIREAKEEANIDIKASDLEIVQVMNMKGPTDEYVHYFFTTKEYSGKLMNMEKNKCEDLVWFEVDKMPTETIEYIKYAYNEYVDNKTLFTLYGYDN